MTAEINGTVEVIEVVNARGARGKSAYEVAQDGGFTGTQEEWLASLEPDPSAFATAAQGALADTAVQAADLTTAVDAAVSGLVAGAPGALDTLNELAAALGDDANFAATVSTALAGKQAIATLDADVAAKLDTPGSALRTSADSRYAARKVHIVMLWGQSNMSGRGTGYTAVTDPTHPRIFQLGAGETTITAAGNVLDMVDTPTGISPGLLFARHLIASLPEDDVVLLVPSAQGNTPLCSAATAAWRWGTAGGLSARAVAQYATAKTAAAAMWPGAQIVTDAILWHQGEADTSATEAQYRTDLLALIAGARAAVGETTPFIMGQLLPQYVQAHPTNPSTAVHASVAQNTAACGYAGGPAFSASQDATHWALSGLRILARSYWDEFQRIRGGRAYRRSAPYMNGETVWAEDFERADTSLDGKAPNLDTYGSLEYDASSSLTVSGGKGTFAGSSQVAAVYGADAVSSGTIAMQVDSMGAYPKVCARYAGYNNHILATQGNGTIYLQTRIAGVQASVASVAHVYAAGDILALRVNDATNEFSVLVNGVEVIAPTVITALKGMNRFGYGTYSGGSGATVVDNVSLKAYIPFGES